MKRSTLGIILMLVAIAIFGFQIGATVKYEDSRYAFLVPVGAAVLLIGIILVFREAARAKKQE